MTGIIYIYYTA